jgi:hypothetical protein
MSNSVLFFNSPSTALKLEFSAAANSMTPYRRRKLENLRKVLSETSSDDEQDLKLLVDRITRVVAENNNFQLPRP